jgi:hypothetical protein
VATLVLLHHANQLLVTDGYADRDGIGPVADAVLAVVTQHETHRLPGSLHLSGTLIEALAWHRPDVLDRVRAATESGLLEAVGGAYGEPVLTQLSDSAVRRHLRVTAEVMERHLGTGEPVSAWVPERVWSPRLGPLLAEAGYRRTALDDRLLLPASERAANDAEGPWAGRPRRLQARLCRLVREDSAGLVVAPITAALRYLVPPRSDDDLALLEALVADLPDDAVLVYADDLERTAGVAGWEPALDRFAWFTGWLATHSGLRVARLDQLPVPGPSSTQPVEAGTYYELAHLHGAGEDYSGWGQDPRWLPYASRVEAVERELTLAEQGRDVDALAERLLLVAQHETGWQDMTPTGRAPAPWARATAAHGDDARPVLHLGRWAARGGCAPSASVVDMDGDGHTELVLADRAMWCAVSPRYGGRVSLLAVRDGADARVVVGNAVDHWNFQEELHRFMQQPPAHPGALGARGAENDPWEVLLPEAVDGAVRVELHRAGEARRLALVDGTLALCWQGDGEITVESLLSPDYLTALREGSRGTTTTDGEGWAGVTAGGRTTWAAWDPAAVRAAPHCTLAGHGASLAVRAHAHLHLVIGTGPVDATTARRRLEVGRTVLHADQLVVPLATRRT